MAAGDDHYISIGRLAHEFALLENQVSMLIWTALEDMNDQRFRAVTAENSWTANLRLLRGLVAIMEPNHEAAPRKEKSETWSLFFKKAERAAKDRNCPRATSDP